MYHQLWSIMRQISSKFEKFEDLVLVKLPPKPQRMIENCTMSGEVCTKTRPSSLSPYEPKGVTSNN